jgi:16S rRNA (guanine527-N7)-methyltransferase
VVDAIVRQGEAEIGEASVQASRKIEVVQARVEAYRPDPEFATITARAVADLPSLVAAVRHLLTGNTTLLAMKGTLPEAEMATLRAGGFSVSSRRLQVPGVEGERHLIEIRAAS